MAVPKRKTSRSRRGQRRSHNALKKINVIIDKKTGEYRLPHHMGADGMYKDRNIIVENPSLQEEEKKEGTQ